MQLRDKVVVITGASRGIGVHIASAFADAGAKLALVARNQENLNEVARGLRERGACVEALAADLRDREGLQPLLARIAEALGPIDVLVNNAGIDRIAAYQDETDADIEDLVWLDLVAPMQLTRAVLPSMLERRAGHVVNVASLAGKGPTPFATSYAAAKHGLVGFSMSLRAELAGTGVSASVVCPGFVRDTGMFHGHSTAAGVSAPRAIGTATPAQVAAATVRAVQRDVAEQLVAPGPMRLFAMLRQLSPDFAASLLERTGAKGLFANVVESQRQKALPVAGAQARSDASSSQGAPHAPREHD